MDRQVCRILGELYLPEVFDVEGFQDRVKTPSC